MKEMIDPIPPRNSPPEEPRTVVEAKPAQRDALADDLAREWNSDDGGEDSAGNR